MLDKEIIEHSDSPFNASVWVVPKKTDASGKQKWRIVIDFRKLNEITDQDAYPLPNPDDILHHLGNAKFFSALDLSSGFHQIPMHPDSKKYTAFSTSDGHFQYNRMPYGLKNAPATFQRMMDTALRGLIDRHCFVYLDDIIIFGNTIEEHNRNLAIVFQRLRDTGLKLQVDKCEFLKPELEYLGHIVTANGIQLNPKKLSAIKEFKTPKTITQVKSFLGLTGYYRKFIRNFAKIAKPLTALTQKNTPYHWTNERQTAFDTLKERLCNPPVLCYPDFQKTFTLTTDASNEGIGAVLSQNDHPCCYISRTLNNAERNYTTTEKELLAIVWSIKRLRQYLLGRKFVIQTDHQALKWLHNVKDPSSRLMRWRLRLEEYDYEIQYKKGKENQVADTLSRLHPLKITSDKTFTNKIKIRNLEKEFNEWKVANTTRKIPIKLTANHRTWTQLGYNELGPFNVQQWLKRLDALTNTNTRIISFGAHRLKLPDIVMLKSMLQFICRDKPVEIIQLAIEPPKTYTKEEKLQIIKENHDLNEHIGETKTLERIKLKHHWTGMDDEVTEYIKNCKTCQTNKLTRIRPREEALISDTPENPNDKIALDIIGPLKLTRKGNQFILSIQDSLTKYLILIPLPDQKADTIINELLEHYIYIFSSPKHILTDQGRNFVCKLMDSFEKAFKIKHIKTTSPTIKWIVRTRSWIYQRHAANQH
ncbi:hypothetical protein QLX08_009211 [Tetragonisca angustula]|uniref:RNA-directed DNA polymerase n=1 Tax=Tetragonisca angustula TaxID=166442 RepID=A0AAW0ZH38_9HYME